MAIVFDFYRADLGSPRAVHDTTDLGRELKRQRVLAVLGLLRHYSGTTYGWACGQRPDGSDAWAWMGAGNYLGGTSDSPRAYEQHWKPWGDYQQWVDTVVARKKAHS